jgi:hypothetical protein
MRRSRRGWARAMRGIISIDFLENRMKIGICGSRLACVMALLVLFGCASVPKSLSSEDRNRIKVVAVRTVLEDDGLSMLDIASVRKNEYSKSYGGMMYGAIGGALEALIIEGTSWYKIRSSIGGSISPIRESIHGYDAKSVFDALVFKGISNALNESNKVQRVQAIGPITSAESSIAADALLKIEYKYGIGVPYERKPLPAITATVSIESLPDNQTLTKEDWKAWIDSSCVEYDYTLDDYAKNGGELYRRCFEQIVEQFGRNVANTYF